MKKSDLYTLVYKISLVYLLISFMLFTVGWMKPLYALICCIIVGLSLLKSFFETVFEDEILISKKEASVLFCGLFIIGIWVGISGIGGVSYQTEDHIWRNAMFETLVNADWPIIAPKLSESDPRGFSYYIGFWIPAVCVGKIFGINAGYMFQIVWAVLGIFLFYLLLCKILNRISLLPLVVFIGFSGMDILGYYILGNDMSAISQTQHLEWWSTVYQFSGFTTQLFWVFNQAIPAWLAIMMILSSKNERNIILIWSSMVLNCTMPFVGALPFIVYKILKNLTNVSELKNWLKNVFTFQNVIGASCIIQI